MADTKNTTIYKRDLSQVLKQARITEKASVLSESGVYVFEVADWANKKEITAAVKKFYGVSPVSINVAKIPSKKVFRRGHVGVKTGGKKAYIELKKGDKIELA